MASELREAQEGYAQARRKVTAAKIRVQRKIELQDPAKAGPAQQIDTVVNENTLKVLEVCLIRSKYMTQIFSNKNYGL